MLRVAAEQDLGDRQANQLGVGEARWSTRATTNEGYQEVVDFDVECHDECVECCFHKLVFGPSPYSLRLLPFRSQFGISHLEVGGLFVYPQANPCLYTTWVG